MRGVAAKQTMECPERNAWEGQKGGEKGGEENRSRESGDVGGGGGSGDQEGGLEEVESKKEMFGRVRSF